nr:MAG TPA: hypothetical protein [Caudoviricetes sp.]
MPSQVCVSFGMSGVCVCVFSFCVVASWSVICMSCAVSFVSAVSPVLGSSMTVAILCASAWRMSVGLPVFVASVMGAGLLGSYMVIVVFVWVVMFPIICGDTGHVRQEFSTGLSTS